MDDNVLRWNDDDIDFQDFVKSIVDSKEFLLGGRYDAIGYVKVDKSLIPVHIKTKHNAKTCAIRVVDSLMALYVFNEIDDKLQRMNKNEENIIWGIVTSPLGNSMNVSAIKK